MIASMLRRLPTLSSSSIRMCGYSITDDIDECLQQLERKAQLPRGDLRVVGDPVPAVASPGDQIGVVRRIESGGAIARKTAGTSDTISAGGYLFERTDEVPEDGNGSRTTVVGMTHGNKRFYGRIHYVQVSAEQEPDPVCDYCNFPFQ